MWFGYPFIHEVENSIDGGEIDIYECRLINIKIYINFVLSSFIALVNNSNA